MKFHSKETKGFLHIERHPGLIWNVDETIPSNLCNLMDTLEPTNVKDVVVRVQAPRGEGAAASGCMASAPRPPPA